MKKICCSVFICNFVAIKINKMEKTDNILKHYNRFYLFSSSSDFKIRSYLLSNIGKQKEKLLAYSFIYDNSVPPTDKNLNLEEFKIDMNKFYIEINDVYEYLNSWEIPLTKYNNTMFKAIIIIKLILCIFYFILGIFSIYYIFGRAILFYFIWIPLVYVFYKLWEKTSDYCIDVFGNHVRLFSQFSPSWKIDAIRLFIDEFNLAVLSYETKKNEWFRGLYLQPNGDLIPQKKQHPTFN